MRKTVFKFGLISGAISALLILAVTPFAYDIGFNWGAVVGYTAMVLSFLLVYFGVRSYRETVGNGQIGFGRAFTVGLLITVISCVCYVITWEIVYYNFFPDFFERYTSHIVEQAKASGASTEQIAAEVQKIEQYKSLYNNPLIFPALAFLEPFPVGLLVTILSALILRKRSKAANSEGSLLAES